ncbi:ATP-binding protein [Streptomyces sasae]|uniref:ATP-binding protein n=1 Tax=Streptomyces sasae TaxID=1266772 RepID=UPI0029303F4C|nr:ATP-binding protein [Streptomyces sasae]
MIELPELVAGGLAAGTLSALALGGSLLRSRRQKAALRAEVTELRDRLESAEGAFISEIEHLAARRMPAAAAQLAHPHLRVPGPIRQNTPGTPTGIALEYVLTALREELTAQRVRIDAAAQAGLRGATREIQAALYRLQDALRGLEQRYDDPELAQTLFALDHENEQSLRRAQVAAVVCGAWVGLAREESHVVDAVTGGQARLAGYHRVRVHNHLEPGTALVSHAVEPAAIIVAELLDNALRHSAPDTDVIVNLEHVHHGVCVTVDDAGLGMTQDERARAQRLVAGSDPILLTDLGDPPRMGLAAIGQLTRQFDLSVDVSSPSPYGGVRAVLRVDSHLLGRIDPQERPPSASAPRSTRERAAPREPGREPAGSGTPTAEPPAPAAPVPAPQPVPKPAPAPVAPVPAAAGHGAEHERAAAPGHPETSDLGGLPQRRRRTRTDASGLPQPPSAVRRPEEAAAALAALQYGTAAARTPKRASAPDPQRTDDEGGAAR